MAKTGAGLGRVDDRRPKHMGAADVAPGGGRKASSSSGDQAPDRWQLEQIIASLTAGVILIEPDQTITYANEAALEMHGVTSLDELGRTVDDYRNNFILRHQGTHLLDHGRTPI